MKRNSSIKHGRTGFLKAISLAFSIVLIAGCGGSVTPAVQLEPSPVSSPEPAAAGTTQSVLVTLTAPVNDPALVSGSAAAACTRLDLNTLTEEQLLATIPDFSSRMVREFFEYRPYVSIQQFRREIGKYVDAAQVAAYEQYVYVPVDPNTADADTLAQLPGVTAEVAASLVAARPFADRQTFLAALGQQVTPDQLAAAACLLVAP